MERNRPHETSKRHGLLLGLSYALIFAYAILSLAKTGTFLYFMSAGGGEVMAAAARDILRYTLPQIGLTVVAGFLIAGLRKRRRWVPRLLIAFFSVHLLIHASAAVTQAGSHYIQRDPETGRLAELGAVQMSLPYALMALDLIVICGFLFDSALGAPFRRQIEFSSLEKSDKVQASQKSCRAS